MSNTKDFKVKNGIKPTVYHEAVGTVVSGSEPYDLAIASYANKSLSVSAQDAAPEGLFFKSDGTSLYVLGGTSDTIYQYTLSTAWDVSTASYASKSFSVAAQEGDTRGLYIKGDGTKLYVVGFAGDSVYQYTLSTPWDIATASYDSISFSVLSQANSVRSVSFNTDGTKMYIGNGGVGLSVYQYTLSTPWNVSTASYDSVSFSTSTQVSALEGVWFSTDGFYFFVSDLNTGNVFKYIMSTSWDISTASYSNQSVDVSTEAGSFGLSDIVFKDGGEVFYIVTNVNDAVYQYNTTATATLDLSTGSVFEVTPTSDLQVTLSNPAASGTVSGATLLLDGALLNTWDISTASRLNTLDVSAQDTDMEGIFLKPDGTKIYSVGYSGDTVEEYSMSTPYDLSTASYVQSFSVNSQETVPSDVFFKSDGTKMYVCGYTGQDINEYSLSTAWNISTASFTDTFSVSSQTTQPDGIAFKPDGTKLYVIGGNNQTVFQYSVATAWDVSTSVYDNKSFSTSSQDVLSRGVRFKTDGTKMYVVGTANDSVYEYNLSTAWDVSTASYVQSFSTGVTNPAGVDFSSDGANMYITDAAGDDLIQYSIGSSATITYDPTIQWAGGTAPTSPAIGETDVVTFTTRDGGTSYSAALAIDGAA